MPYGIKVSKKGYDVKTADDKDLIISSDYLPLKIWTVETKDLSFPDYKYGDPLAISTQYVSYSNLACDRPIFRGMFSDVSGFAKWYDLPKYLAADGPSGGVYDVVFAIQEPAEKRVKLVHQHQSSWDGHTGEPDPSYCKIKLFIFANKIE